MRFWRRLLVSGLLACTAVVVVVGVRSADASGTLTLPFNTSSYSIGSIYTGSHTGYDLRPSGTQTITAAAPGYASKFLDDNCNPDKPKYNDPPCDDGKCNWGESWGRYVIIDHGNNFRTVYAHLSSFASDIPGDVSRGQAIGVEGEAGCATGIHLHFEVHQNGAAVDPGCPRTETGCNKGCDLNYWTQCPAVPAPPSCAYQVGQDSSRQSVFTGAFARVKSRGVDLGCPTGPTVWWCPPASGCSVRQEFNGASIIHDEGRDTPALSVPAFVIWGGIRDCYFASYAHLGPPTTDEYIVAAASPFRAQQGFAQGFIRWTEGENCSLVQTWPDNFPDWKAEYFDLTSNHVISGGPGYVRNEFCVCYDWSAAAPGNGSMGIWSDDFGARWRRTISTTGGAFLFHVNADDGVRMWIDGQLVLDKWFDQPNAQYDVAQQLSAGQHNLKVEYYEHSGAAAVGVSWVGPTPPPTPTPTQTPTTPTPTPTPTPTGSPTPTPSPTPGKHGDVDCNGTVGATDALKILRFLANMSVSQQPDCPRIGTGSPFENGDVDCNGTVGATDALKVLRYVANLSVSQQPGCALIGA